MTIGAAELVVHEPGLLTTVQDLGRVGYAASGVGRGGAADALTLRMGNRLVGNPDAAAALEFTLTGGRYEFQSDARLVLAGDMQATLLTPHGDVRVECWTPLVVPRSAQLVLGGMRTGARSYLCIAGGIAVPVLLGSRATHRLGGFGGHEGRALQAGDVVPLGNARSASKSVAAQHAHVGDSESIPTTGDSQSGAGAAEKRARARAWSAHIRTQRVLRAVPGAHHDEFSPAAIAAFWNSEFQVTPESDRSGVRLTGARTEAPHGGTLPSEGMFCGAVQVPHGGEPIALLVDYPATGGYPVIAAVADVDLPALGQLSPHARIRFERVTIAAARALFADFETRLAQELPSP